MNSPLFVCGIDCLVENLILLNLSFLRKVSSEDSDKINRISKECCSRLIYSVMESNTTTVGSGSQFNFISKKYHLSDMMKVISYVYGNGKCAIIPVC